LAIGEQHHQCRQPLALRVGRLLGQVIERLRQPIADRRGTLRPQPLDARSTAA